MAKKELDNLSLDMIECEKAGFGVHYGWWRSSLGYEKIERKTDVLQEGWRTCAFCGEPFKLSNKGKNRLYCDISCQRKASNKNRDKDKQKQYEIRYRERKKLEKAGGLA